MVLRKWCSLQHRKCILVTVLLMITLMIGRFYVIEYKTSAIREHPLGIPTTLFDSQSRVVNSSLEGGTVVEESTKGHNLMILSYMRSGSSMNGQVFRDTPGDFYVYEPLIMVAPYQYLTESQICNMRNANCRGDNNESDVSRAIARTFKILKRLYTCRIRQLDRETLASIIFEWKGSRSQSSDSWQNLTECYVKLTAPNATNTAQFVAKNKNSKEEQAVTLAKYVNRTKPDVFTDLKSEAIDTCLNQLESDCLKAKTKVTKVLRISLRLLPMILTEFPDLKVMFVLRDPRGIVNSRIQTVWFPVKEEDPKQVEENVRGLCDKMNEDARMAKKLKKAFPGRFIDFRLEDIAENPVARFEKIFRMMNIVKTDGYVEKIKSLFTAKPDFLSKWNTTLKDQYIRLTEEKCEYVSEKYHYEKLKLSNSSI